MDKIPSWLIKLISGAVAVLLLILIVEQVMNLSSKTKTIDDKHIVTISAQGKITAKPDLLEINAGVIANGATAVEAQKLNTEKMNQVISYLKGQGIDPKDIQTTNYSDSPNYDYRVVPPVINGYVANQTVTVKVHNLDTAGLLDGLTKNGANQINSANYTFADPDAIREQARELALANAKDKAQKLAKAAGVQLGSLVTFTEDQNANPYPIPYTLDAGAAGKGGGPVAAPTQIEPGTQDITASVTVTYSLK